MIVLDPSQWVTFSIKSVAPVFWITTLYFVIVLKLLDGAVHEMRIDVFTSEVVITIGLSGH
jgi:hypothetical protein